MKTLWMMIDSAEKWHRLAFGQLWKEWEQTLDLMPSDQILLEDSLKWQNLTLTLQNHFVRAYLITGGRLERLTLTLAPTGMVALWRCQEPQTSGRADQCFQPLGDVVIISANDTRLWLIYWLKPDSSRHNYETNMTENWLTNDSWLT